MIQKKFYFSIILILLTIIGSGSSIRVNNLTLTQTDLTKLQLSNQIKSQELYQFEVLENKVNGEMITEGDYAYLNKIDLKILKDVSKINWLEAPQDLEDYFDIEVDEKSVDNSFQAWETAKSVFDDIFFYFTPSSAEFLNGSLFNLEDLMIEICCNKTETLVSETGFEVFSKPWTNIYFSEQYNTMEWFHDCQNEPCSRYEIITGIDGVLIHLLVVIRAGYLQHDPESYMSFELAFLQKLEFQNDKKDNFNYLLLVPVIILALYLIRRYYKKKEDEETI